MAIVKTFDLHEFISEFRTYGRKDQFSPKGLEVIFNYLSDCYSDSSFEMDVIAICCEFQELTEEEIRQNYDIEEWQEIEDYLNDETSVVGKTEDSFVFVQF
jgi:hypothetical protein